MWYHDLEYTYYHYKIGAVFVQLDRDVDDALWSITLGTDCVATTPSVMQMVAFAEDGRDILSLTQGNSRPFQRTPTSLIADQVRMQSILLQQAAHDADRGPKSSEEH